MTKEVPWKLIFSILLIRLIVTSQMTMLVLLPIATFCLLLLSRFSDLLSNQKTLSGPNPAQDRSKNAQQYVVSTLLREFQNDKLN